MSEIIDNNNVDKKRCQTGKRWNTKTKRCEDKKPKKYTFKRGEGKGQVILQRKPTESNDLQKDAQTIPEALLSLSKQITEMHPLQFNKNTTKNDENDENELTAIKPAEVKPVSLVQEIIDSNKSLQQNPIQIIKSKKRIKIVKPNTNESINDNVDYNSMTGQQLRDIWALLMGLATGQNSSGKFSRKDDLIQEIIRLKSGDKSGENKSDDKHSEDIDYGTTISQPSIHVPEEPFLQEFQNRGEKEENDQENDQEKDEEKDDEEEEKEPLVEPIIEEDADDAEKEEEEDEEEDTEEKEKEKYKNKELFDMEYKEHELAKTDTSYEFLYPDINDPNFNIKISKRKEFNDTKYDGTIYDIKKQAELLCNADFELMPHQLFVKNFLSFQTPYNSLLLYNALGTGKSCSAIGVAEEMRSYMRQVGIAKKILVIASPNVQANFRMQLFDENKLQEENGLWSLNTCVGNSLLKEINPTNLKGIPREKIVSQIKSIVNSYYTFLGYTELANYITKRTIVSDDSGLSEIEKRTIETKKIRKVFNNSLIIIDEVHNLRITDDNKNKRTSVLLMKVAKYANNLRLLFLSATPMYNSYKEIIWLINLMNLNDKRSTITEDDIFDKDGNFIEGNNEEGGNEGKGNKEGGRELLQRKMTGYVSYVRGENPYTFPFRIYPDLFSPDNLIKAEDYPKLQMNKKPIETPIKYVPVFVSKIGEYQHKGYEFIMENMRKRSFTKSNSFGDEKIMPTFENMDKFGYTLLEVPIESLNIVYPSLKFDDFTYSINNKVTNLNNSIDATNDATNNATSEEKPYNQEEYTELITNMIGKRGLSNIMTYETIKSPQPMRFNFDYKPEILSKYNKIFTKENIGKYSNKIGKVCDSVTKSKGIIIIYSQYIDGGCVPIALALEELGFTRYGSEPYTKSLLKNPPEPIDSISMKPKSQVTDNTFRQARYVMITGDPSFSPNNANDIKYVTSKDNKNGELVKVIIISKAASEGLDFKNIRQVHIMEPWYNMNRIEQIIGRGVRNLSHCGLPFEDRNVEIYLHGTLPMNDEEPADLYVYRLAEKKALQIGKVTRVLKESAVDCLLNIGQTNFTTDKMLAMAENTNIKINLSSKSEPIEFKFGDKDYTDVCDYMECQKDFKCSPHAEINDTEIIKDTYSEEFVKMNYPMILKRIRQLYREQTFYKKDQLFQSINLVKKYPEEQIYYCLSQIIDNKNEYLIDRYGRRGYLINRGDYYAFQPNEITFENSSIFERDIPVDYKRDSILLEINKNPITKDIGTKDSGDREAGDKTGEAIDDKNSESIKDNIESQHLSRTYDEIITELKKSLDSALNSKSIETGDTDWYIHISQILDILTSVHKIPIETITKFVVFHFLDCLELKDRLTIINTLYSMEFEIEKEKMIEEIVHSYFDDKIVTSRNVKFILLSDMKLMKSFVLKEGKWIETRQVDREKIVQQQNEKFLIEKSNINNFVGFMSVFKNQNLTFKTKDISQTRNNTGAVCSNAGKNDIIKRLNAVLEDNKYSIKNTDSILKIGLCAILEILLRYFTEINYKGYNKIYFMDSEHALLNGISEL